MNRSLRRLTWLVSVMFISALSYATNPRIDSLSPGSGPISTQVQVNGAGFGATQGSSAVTFNGVAASVVSWSDAKVVATVPTTATTGIVKVTVGGVASNLNVFFTVPPPRITSISPTSGVVGTQVTISGSGFQATKGNNYVSFTGGGTATTTSWSDTQIVATVPSNAYTGPVMVFVNGIESNLDGVFTMPNPIITGLSPGSGPGGTQVQINGSGFGATQGTSTISFNGTSPTVVSWSDSQVVATVPSTATSGAVRISVGGVVSNTNVYFTVSPPSVASISPTSGVVGTQVTINGSAFQSTQGSSYVQFSNRTATIVSWSATQVVATVPANAVTGSVSVVVNGVTSNQNVVFTMPSPAVTGLSPTSGSVGTQVQINGSGFGATQGTSTVTFNGTNAAIVSWSDTQVVATVPSGATSGGVKVTEGGVASNTNTFTVGSFVINSVSPLAGPTGTQVTVSGFGFGASQGSSTISFNGSAATVSSWSDAQIIATVPSGATTGAVTVVKSGTTSNSNVSFTVGAVAVNSVSPVSGPVGTQVQINGGGFGATQGSSTVTFNGISASVVSWSATQITATVPSAATSGSVKVTVGGVGSNTTVTFAIPGPQITGISPTSGVVGTQVTVSGSGFQATRGSSYVSFNGTTATVNSWSDSQVVATVAAGTTTGPVTITVNGVGSNQNISFTLPNPIISGLSPASGSVGTQVQINGSGFGATQGSSTVTFNSVSASVVSWSDAQVVATVPTTATTGTVRVSVGGVGSTPNEYFTVPYPQVTTLSPTSGVVGTQVTVNGSGFQAAKGSSTVSLNGTNATVVSWSDTQIVATVTAGATTGPVKVSVNGFANSQYVVFSMPEPIITGLSPASGSAGAQVQINGSGFGATQGSSTVAFQGASAAIVNWSNTQITVTVPAAATNGVVQVNVGGVVSTPNMYFSVLAPRLDSLFPGSAGAGNAITITGGNFQASQGSNYVRFNGVTAAVVSWSNTQIVATVPSGATSGPVAVTVNGATSNSLTFTVPSLAISSVSPTSGPVGTQVTVTGTAFGASQGTSTITFNGASPASITSWSNTQIVATISNTTITGPVEVLVNNVASNVTVNFSVPLPSIASISPVGGAVGTQVTVTGSGFQATQRNSIIQFNGITATVSSWSDAQIVATAPSSATTGSVVVTVNSLQSNGVLFTVPNMLISSVTPPSAAVGALVTLAGSGFGATAGNTQVEFNGAITSVTTWSDTSITAYVPAAATNGPVTVNMYGVASNGVQFTVEGQSNISSISPTSGPVGSSVTISGSGFGATQSTSTVTFDTIPASVTSWGDTQVVATVPSGASTGPVSVVVGGISGSSPTFVVNATIQLTDSLGNQSSYTAVIEGGKWYVSDAQGSGCSSCTQRETIHNTYDNSGNILSTTDELGTHDYLHLRFQQQSALTKHPARFQQHRHHFVHLQQFRRSADHDRSAGQQRLPTHTMPMAICSPLHLRRPTAAHLPASRNSLTTPKAS